MASPAGSANGGIIGKSNKASFGKNKLTTTTCTGSTTLTTQPGTRLVDTLVVGGGGGAPGDRGGGGGQAMQSPTVSSPGVTTIITPTKAEVSQSQAADAYDVRKTKARGRSSTILTSSRGVRLDDTLTLGKKSLLGA